MRDSQKPPDELYANFKANWNSSPLTTTAPSSIALEATHVTASILSASVDARHYADLSEGKDLDTTPRAHLEDWKYANHFGDHHASAYANFYNPFHGVFTPTPGGTALYHSQAAGDLHATGYGFGLGTPVSHPNSTSGIFHDPSSLNLSDPHLTSMSPRHFQHTPGFSGHSTFSPPNFPQDMPGFDPGHHALDASTQRLAVGLNEGDALNVLSPVRGHEQLTAHASNDHFRFRVSLSAATAMVKTSDEIPVTYLNKGQAYSISVIDTLRQPPLSQRIKYRTFVRVSFEDEQQRVRPGACWQLWKEGRGMNEAHHRGGKLQAVEYVETSQGDPEDKPSGPHVEYESFDGFSVTWFSRPNGTSECSLAVRFNFLSTDFSHSKGVKGIPVRLCTKTEVVDPTPAQLSENAPTQELCYCKVKLFRDHGAERKLANDIAHVKKTIEKLKQQIAQIESGGKDTGKRKRTSSTAGFPTGTRPMKAARVKRSESTSTDSSSGVQHSPEEDLHLRLAGLQAMFTSTSPISVLFLQGENQDDPDLYPVSLQDQPPALPTGSSHESAQKSTTSLMSPSPSYLSGTTDRRDSTLKVPVPPNAVSRVSSEESSFGRKSVSQDQPTMKQVASPEVPVKIQLPSTAASAAGPEVIQVLNVDASYEPPPERKVKPVACFYVKHQPIDKDPIDNYYRAVYLGQRTLSEFISSVASKFGFDVRGITGAVWINKAGLSIKVDDDVIQEFPEGQDMTVHFAERQVNPSWDFLDAVPTDEEPEKPGIYSSSGLELVLQA